MQPSLASVLPSIAFCATLTAQSHLVVPVANTNTDALSYEWIAGASRTHRQQTLVGATHIQALLGRQIDAIELRRTAVAEAYQGGAMTFAVTLSTLAITP